MDGPAFSSDIAFTPTVKAIQARKGSRGAYARMEQGGGWKTELSADLKDFIEAQTSVFLATANREGQPTIQHRGGPAGFLKVLDEKTIGFADFRGNTQLITVGNISNDDRVSLFLMDYPRKTRLKILGHAKVVDAAAHPELALPDYKAKFERAMIITVEGFDWNCQQHITPRFNAEEIKLISRLTRE